MKIDSTTSTSPTRSLALHVPGIGTAHAQLASVTYPNVAHARVAFSMKCGAASRIMSLMRLQVGVANRAATFDLYMRPDRFVVDENVIGTPSLGYFDYTIASGIKPSMWQRWVLELDATGAAALGIVTIDGVERLRTTLKNSFVRGDFSVLMGIFYAPDGPEQDVSYDDVSITLLP